jgi:beta-lactam-binding protein with PASTA domain
VAQEPWPDPAGAAPSHSVSATDGAVDLLVSRGPEPAVYVMPDLSARRLDEVERMARRYGMRLGGVSRQPADGSQRGLVLRQTPEAGFPVSQRDIIMLVIGE